MAKGVRMADIAEKLGISIVSVSKALAGKDGVSEEMRAKKTLHGGGVGLPFTCCQGDGHAADRRTDHRRAGGRSLF